MNGCLFDLSWMDECIFVIVEIWFLGSQFGYVIVDVLIGVYNFLGKLLVCFFCFVGQLLFYYSQKNIGCFGDEYYLYIFWLGYIDECMDVFYFFGYGLSYIEFIISDLKFNILIFMLGEVLMVSFIFMNIGDWVGYEVVQLYMCDYMGSSICLVWELKRFQKVFLEFGQCCKIIFEFMEVDLVFYMVYGKWEVELGCFLVFVGNSFKVDLEVEFELVVFWQGLGILEGSK